MDLASSLFLVLMPILLTAFLFVMAAVNHLSLKLARAASAGFEGTFRALTYSSAPLVLSLVPVVGPIVGILWSMSLTFMAFKHIHKTTYLRVAIAYTMTMAAVMLIANGIGVLFSNPLP
jgi:hypothetical protein